MKKKLMLLVLDGFGEGKPVDTNAIYAAKTPFIDRLKKEHPWSLLEPGGETVGVLPGQFGGSDVGHNTIGTGQVIRQPVKIIYDALQDKSFFQNKALLQAINHAKKNNSNLHLLGIGSDSYVHALTDYIFAILDLCKKENFPGDRVFLHLARDGRDTPMDSAIEYFTKIENECKKRGIGKIASMFGRVLLDRGRNWKRTEKLYDLLTDEKTAPSTEDWKAALQDDYSHEVWDENAPPMVIGKGTHTRIASNDAVINFTYRADRERQITQALTEPQFKLFTRKKQLENLYYVGFINYSPKLKFSHTAFEEESAKICLSELLEQNGYKQLHVAGSEKFIFVTYNFNRCKLTSNLDLEHEEDEKMAQTKDVETFDQNPEMSAPNLTRFLLKNLEQDEKDIYIVNYENCDQVGHTGNLPAAIKAVEAVEEGLSQVVPKALEKGFDVIITADHGNADIMVNENAEPHTAHTHNKVPCILVSDKLKNISLSDGTLADVAPTILDILGIPKPEVMKGKSLLAVSE